VAEVLQSLQQLTTDINRQLTGYHPNYAPFYADQIPSSLFLIDDSGKDFDQSLSFIHILTGNLTKKMT